MSKSFLFSYTKNTKLPVSQLLTVAVADSVTLQEVALSVNASITPLASWVAASPSSGSTVLKSNIGLNQSVKNLTPGTYSTKLQVSAPAPITNSPVFADVVLQVKNKRRG